MLQQFKNNAVWNLYVRVIALWDVLNYVTQGGVGGVKHVWFDMVKRISQLVSGESRAKSVHILLPLVIA